MTARAILGLAVLNAVYLAVGASLLWALRGWRSWSGFARLAGLAYLLGVAALGAVWTILLVVGVSFGVATIIVSAAVLVAAAVAAGRRLGRTRPPGRPELTLTWLSLVTATGLALTGVFLEALFRAARLQGLYAFDAWAFWVPKAKAIYEFGVLDEQFFTELWGPTYPPLVPILDAAAFHAMGSADVVTLHLQFWFFTLGFVAAVVGLLWRRAPGWILWPLVVLMLIMPRASARLFTPQADFLLDFFFCMAVLLAALWLLDRAPWRLVAVTVLLGASVLTKREGVLLAAVLLVALAIASFDRRRFAWPRIALSALAVGVIGLPWRLWYRARGIGGEAPTDLSLDLERATDALRLALDVFFDTSLWSILPLLGVAAVAVAAIWGDRRLALFLGVVLGLVVLAGTWITLAYPELPVTADEAVNPIVRYLASAVLLAGVAAPLLLAGVWTRAREARKATA